MTQAQLIAAAARRFPVVHLAHLQDATYPFDPGVKQELAAMQNAGFPVTLLTTPGDHYDNPGRHGLPGTDADTVQLLLPHIDDGGWHPRETTTTYSRRPDIPGLCLTVRDCGAPRCIRPRHD